jgi:uncharacterized protein
VIGIFHKDMEKARDGLIAVLAGYRKIKDHEITVVFDGYKSGMASQSISYKGNVKVIYSRLGESADDVIKKTVSQERREWIVVTADRDIADHAWSVGSVPVPPERFMDIVTRQGPETGDSLIRESAVYDKDEEGEEGRPRHGNPHMLSKKEKALRRVLGKL